MKIYFKMLTQIKSTEYISSLINVFLELLLIKFLGEISMFIFYLLFKKSKVFIEINNLEYIFLNIK